MSELTLAEWLRVYEIMDKWKGNFEVQHAVDWDYQLSATLEIIVRNMKAEIHQMPKIKGV